MAGATAVARHPTMPSKTCFFICGAGRSGSTYLHHLLKVHPRIALTDEARVLDAACLAFEAVTLPYGEHSPTRGFQGVIDPDCIETFGEVFVDHVMPMLEEFYERVFGPEHTHFGDKLPDPFCVVSAKRFHPAIHCIMMVRDPRDVVCSYKTLTELPIEEILGPQWRKLAPRWEEMAESTVEQFAQVWQATYDHLVGNIADLHTVRYPDLLADPVGTAEGVLAALDLPMDASVEAAAHDNVSFSQHGTSRSPEASVARWQKELTPEEVSAVLEHCGPLMDRLGIPR